MVCGALWCCVVLSGGVVVLCGCAVWWSVVECGGVWWSVECTSECPFPADGSYRPQCRSLSLEFVHYLSVYIYNKCFTCYIGASYHYLDLCVPSIHARLCFRFGGALSS